MEDSDSSIGTGSDGGGEAEPMGIGAQEGSRLPHASSSLDLTGAAIREHETAGGGSARVSNQFAGP